MSLKNYFCIFAYTTILIYFYIALKLAAEVRKVNVDSIPADVRVLGKFRLHFFTIWNFVLQIIFLLTAILDEFSNIFNLSLQIRKNLGRTRAFIFNTLVFPSTLLVVTIFWTLWNIDRELILPRKFDPFYPLWLNHTMHTLILVPLAIELALPKKYHFVRFEKVALILVAYAVTYQLLYFSIYLRFGIWLYPVYGVLTWIQRLLFSVLQLCMLLTYQKIGIRIQNNKRMNEKQKLV